MDKTVRGSLSERLRLGSQLSLRGLLHIIKESEEDIESGEVLDLIGRYFNWGVYVVPDDIADLMAGIGKVLRPESVMDINCGIGHVLQRCDYAEVRIGIDRNPEAIELAAHLYPQVVFQVGDILHANIGRKFDLVISALPFGQRVRCDDGKTHPVEKLLLEKALALLNQGGTVVCLVPCNVLTASLYEEFRKDVLKSYALDMIVSLPSGALPFTGVQTCILVIRDGRPREKVYLASYNQNGSKIIENFRAGTGSPQISLSQMENRWDSHFHDSRFGYVEQYLEGKEVKRLEEISEIVRGYRVRRECLKPEGAYLVLSPRNIHGDRIEATSHDRYIDEIDDVRFTKSIAREGDVIVSLVSSPVVYICRQGDPPAIAGPHVAIVRSRDNEYIKTYLHTGQGLGLFGGQADREVHGATIPRLSVSSLRKIRIPIIPLADPNAVSDEAIRNTSLNGLAVLEEELDFHKREYAKEKGMNDAIRFIVDILNRVMLEETSRSRSAEALAGDPTLAARLAAITGDGNVVGDHNVATVNKMSAGDHAIQIGQLHLTLSPDQLGSLPVSAYAASPLPAPSTELPRQLDAFTPYETGLAHFLERLEQDHPRYTEALTLEAQLRENVGQARLDGDTETRRADRARILRELNRLALQTVRISFNTLCGLPDVETGGASLPLRVVQSVNPEQERQLKVFLCHASGDKPAVRKLYHRLCAAGIDPWLDEENLLPGQDWRLKIPKAVRSSDVIIICLSSRAVTKAGYFQKEIKYALDVADEQPEGAIFLIPLRLEECEVPERLSRWHWVDLFQKTGYKRLLRALRARAKHLQLAPLYEQLQAAAGRREWAEVLALGGRIQALDPAYRDVAKWMGRAHDQLPRPPRPPLVGGVVALLVVIGVAVVAFLGRLEPSPTPAEGDIGDTWTRPADGMVMVYVPAGEFLMGSSNADGEAGAQEKPQHPVYLDGYWIDRTEVTNAQYRKCVEAGACQEPGCWNNSDVNAPDQPVVCVSWDEAQAYAAWVGGRLPTEAEWEKAARGTDGRIYPWGNKFDGTRLNYCDRNCESAWKDTSADDGYALTAPVGSYPAGASPYGALDMVGNVSEWVADRYDAGYYARSPARNPQGPDSGDVRVSRGGAFYPEKWYVRCAARLGNPPDSRSNYSGFRLVASPVGL